MKPFFKFFVIFMAAFFFIGLSFTTTSAQNTETETELTKHIVIFKQDVSWDTVIDISRQWKEESAIETVLKLPLINALSVLVPSFVSVETLESDPRVEVVETDGRIDHTGQAPTTKTSFIKKTKKPPHGYYPWGALEFLDLPYDPESVYSLMDMDDVPFTIAFGLHRLTYRKIRVAFFDTGISPDHEYIKDSLMEGLDIVNKAGLDSEDPLPVTGIAADDNGHGTQVAGIFAAALDKEMGWGKKCL